MAALVQDPTMPIVADQEMRDAPEYNFSFQEINATIVAHLTVFFEKKQVSAQEDEACFASCYDYYKYNNNANRRRL